MHLHMSHISGNRMIDIGIDGGSCGNQDAGVLLGFDVRTYIPLDKTAFEMAGEPLENWLRGWLGRDFSPPLEPIGWFTQEHLPDVHLWAPPPGLAFIVLKN